MALIVDRSKAGLPAGYWLWQEKGGRPAAATGARGRPAARPGARVGVRLIRAVGTRVETRARGPAPHGGLSAA
jgi:hypothetical protein